MNFEVTVNVEMTVWVNAASADEAEERVVDHIEDGIDVPRDRISVKNVDVTDVENLDQSTVVW